jgi:hypothetical protein
MKLRVFLLPLVGLALFGLVACGGGKKSSSSSSSGSSSSSSSSGDATLDLDKAFKSLGDLKSFHFDAAMKLDSGSAGSAPTGGSGADDAATTALILGFLSDIQANGSFVAPDQTDMTFKVGGQNFGLVTIGKKSWVKFGNTWQANDDADSTDLSSLTDLFSSGTGITGSTGGTNDVLKGGKTSQETVNGVKTTHYSFDKNAIQGMNTDLGGTDADFKSIDKASMDIWENSDNVPVKFSISIAGKDDQNKKIAFDFQMNIKDINSNITVKPPI